MVEWKKLISVSDVLYGYPFESSLFTEDSENIPLIRIRDVKPAKASTYYSGHILEDYRIKRGDILVGMDGEFNLGKWDDRDGLLNQRVLKLKGKDGLCLDSFLFHYMGPVFKKIEKETAGGSVKHLSAKAINQIIIPVPPLNKQEQIVDILDTFTSSNDNLKQQIAQRRKQYEYYRDRILNLTSKEWPSVTLKDVAIIKNGKDYKNLLKGNIPVYGSGGIMTYVDEFASERPSVLLPRKGSVENIFYVEEPFWTVDTIYWTDINTSKVLPKYLFYSLLRYNLKEYAYGGARPSLSQPILYKLELPLPSLEKQNEIVDILDKFETSIQNLEAQLSQREKQYEYYRNKLLTFE